jgi:beta-lactamase class A
MMRQLTGVLSVLLMCFMFPAHAMNDQDRAIQELRRLETEFGGHLGVMAKNLRTGEILAYNDTERYPTASAIKFPVMAAFFHLVDLQRVDPHARVMVQRDDKKPGSGILQFLSDSTSITLLDAVKLMIMYSDNTATNLVLDHLSDTHEGRMRVVNEFLAEQGLQQTRILNRLYTLETKQSTPEAIRYGIGVSTPTDMVTLLEALYRETLADSASCEAMVDIMKLQSDHGMIPRFLPEEMCRSFAVAHKTGGVNETKVDVGLVLSDTLDMAIAIFVDKHPDHRDGLNNRAVLLAARASRAAWNYFTGMTGYDDRRVLDHDVDWNTFPGGRWGIYRTPAAPFPHPKRLNGFTRDDGTFFPYSPHYCDSSVTVVVPDSLRETAEGTNIIVHFHGHLDDNMQTLERYSFPQALIAQRINAILVLPQGPYRARDSFGGKMEDDGGLKRLVDDVLETMKREGILKTARLRKLLVSGHSGGGRAAALSLTRGGVGDYVTDLFLFDALYEQEDAIREWLLGGKGTVTGCFTDHLAKQYVEFERSVGEKARERVRFSKSPVDHWKLLEVFFPKWLSTLDAEWKYDTK